MRAPGPRPPGGAPVRPAPRRRPSGPPAQLPRAVAWLLCDPFPPFPLREGQTVRVGRLEENDLVLPHNTVSRRQAEIVVREGRLALSNASSLGTFVNGEQVSERALEAGDRIVMGAYELVVATTLETPDLAEATRPLRLLLDAADAKRGDEPAPRVSMTYYGEDSSLLANETEAADAGSITKDRLGKDAPRALTSRDGARTFTVLRELGRGGQGVVYEVAVEGDQRARGFSNPVRRAVAKFPLPGVPEAEDCIRREERVYRTPDPGLVNLLDVGEHEGRPFLVLERLHPHPFCLGEERAPVEPVLAVETYVNLLEVLHRLHTRREGALVLCDVKPENVMIRLSAYGGELTPGEYERRVRGKSYEPVFMDMGCAQDRKGLNASGGALDSIVGTLPYLPPEALPASDADERVRPGHYTDKTDVYALTLCLYEFLTGRRPYEHEGLYELEGDPYLSALLDLKQHRIPPHETDVLQERFGESDARVLLEVLNAGLAPQPEMRLSARELLKLCRTRFQVGETRVLTLSEYYFDAVHGIHLEQRRFKEGTKRWMAD